MEKSTMSKGMKKRVVAVLTGGIMIISMCVPAFATEGDTTTKISPLLLQLKEVL